MGVRVIGVEEIGIDGIRIPEWSERIVVSEHEIDEIAESIRSSIQIEPIIVRRLDDGSHELISGYMRLNALKRLGYRTVEAKIVKCSNEEALTISLEENLKRSEMHQFDIAKKVAYMHKGLGMSVREIARRLNRDHSWVVMMLAIDSISPEAKEILAPRIKDTPTLYEISKLENPRDQVLASKIIAERGLGRREAQGLIRGIMERGSGAVDGEYQGLPQGLEAGGGEGLYDSKVVNMLTTYQGYKACSGEAAPKPQAPEEAREVRACDICGKKRLKGGVRFIAICRDGHEALHDLVEMPKKHGYRKVEKALEPIVENLDIFLSYPEDQQREIMHNLIELARMVRGLDLETIRELVEEAKKSHAKD